MKSPKIVNAVICEDTRIEDKGKHILIGVFPEDIVVSKKPSRIRITFWLQLDGIGQEEEIFLFRATLENESLAAGEVHITKIRGTDRATITLGPLILTIEEPGELRLDIKYADDGRWKKAINIPVRMNLSTNESSPPSEQSPTVAPSSKS
jgi:hypothetical protein